MSDQPQSSDGLVCPEAFPCKSADINTDNITSGAQSLRAMGNDVDARMDAIAGHWLGLAGVYEAPEQEIVYGLMRPAAAASEQMKSTFGKAADAVDEFATAISPMKSELAALEQEAESFRAEALAGYDGKSWRQHQPAVDRNRELLQRYANVVQTLTTAAAECANTIKSLVTSKCMALSEGISADAVMSSGEMLPWGAPVEKDRNCGESVVHGTGNFLKGTWEGFTALGGFGPEGWSLDNLKNTWVGVGDFVGSTLLLSSPFVSGAIKFFGDDDVDAWVDRRHDVAKAAWTGMVGFDYRAHMQGKDGWHKYREDGVAAFTESFLNVGSMFIPGGGAAGAGMKIIAGGGKAASWGAKVVNAAGKIADFGLPGGGWIVAGGVKVFNVGSDAVRVLDDVVAAGRNVPGARLVPSLDDLVPARKPVSEMCHFDESATSGRSATAGVDTPVKPQPGIENVSVKARPGGVDVSAMGKGIEAPGGGRPGPVGDGVRSSSLVDDVSAGGKPSVSEISESPTARGGASGSGTRPEVEGPQALRDGDVESRPGGGESRDEGGSGQRSDSDGGDHTSRGTADEPTRHVDQAGDGIRHSGGDASIDRAPDVDVMPERGSGASSGEVPEGKPTHDPHGRLYEYDDAGRAHVEGDPPDTYRTESDGRLHDDGAKYVTDSNRPEIEGVESAERLESSTVDMDADVRVPGWDDCGTTFAEDVAARKDLQVQHTQDLQARNKLAEELGIDTKDLTKDKRQETLDQAVEDRKISKSQSKELLYLAEVESRSADALRSASERLGERAADTQMALNGEAALFEAAGKSGAGMFDRVGVGGEPPGISFYEAKGGNSTLGSRTVDGIKCQQGSTGYLNELARMDERYLEGLRDYLRRADPSDPVAKAIREGTIEIRYVLVRAKPNGTVVSTPFKLDPARLDLPKP